jgi:hypothetical protein
MKRNMKAILCESSKASNFPNAYEFSSFSKFKFVLDVQYWGLFTLAINYELEVEHKQA